MNLTDTERAYLAGLFDGESTIGYYFKSKLGYHRAQVAIYNSDPRIMDWLLNKIPYGTIGSNGNKQGHKTFSWSISSNKYAKEFLTLIRPYLVVKADQVDLLFSLWDSERKIRSSHKLSPEILSLRKETEYQMKHLKTASFQMSHNQEATSVF